MAGDLKENMAPMDGHSVGAGAGLKIDVLAPRIVRFGESDNDIFLLKDDDAERAALVRSLKADPTSPDKWLALLRAPPSYEGTAFSRARLHRRATALIPKDKRGLASVAEIYVRSALARETEKEARDTFKWMKSVHMGEGEPWFYEQYAAFEYLHGNHLEADEVLSLGVRNGVFTARDKELKYQNLVRGVMPELPKASAPSSASLSRHLQTPREQKSSVARSFSTPGGDSTVSTAASILTTPGTMSATSTTGFSTARKAPLLSTPLTRPTASAQTSRKATPGSRLFNLGGPPLRVTASDETKGTGANDEDEDDDDMGMKEELKPKVVPLSPIRESASDVRSFVSSAMTSTTSSVPSVRKTSGAASLTSKPAQDLSYIKNWTPRPISSMSSTARAPSFDHNNKDLYPSPKRQNTGTDGVNRGASGPQIRLDPHSPISVGSTSSASSPISSTDSSVPRDPFASLTSKVVVNGLTYIKLEQIGSGGSSKVYRMLGPDLKIYALKKIKLKRLDPKSIEQYTNEIQLLQRLQGNPFIIRLIAAEQDMQQRAINVMMEHGEIDLGERLRELKDGLDENFLRVIWTQMLQAVHAIHSERIIHGDLKPANFLFVNGTLKLIDFGIAKAISNDTTNIERDSQVGTVNFMSPEAIQGNTGPGGQRNPQGKMKVGRASDIWSLGCILYQIVYGKPPFADLNSIIEKFRCIIDPAYQIPFPSLKNKDLEDVIRKCLQRDHRARPTIDGPNGLLSHAFLRNSSNGLSVTPENGSVVLQQMAELLRAQGVDSTKVATFVSIGKEGLHAVSDSSSDDFRYRPKREAYKYDTEERRTEI